MEKQNLGIYGWGLYLPKVVSVEEMVKSAGGNPDNYLTYGWQNACVANEKEHPNFMVMEAVKRALESTQIKPESIKLVISTAEAHDYLEMSTAMEVMRELNLPTSTVGFDIYQDCMATVTALEIAKGWLTSLGGGYGVIVSGERFNETIDKSDKENEVFWGFGDGASAMIVGVNTPGTPKINFLASSFHTKGSQNGYLHPVYGGTKFRIAPTGENPFKRRPPHISGDGMFLSYIAGYETAIIELRSKNKFDSNWLVCSQTSPGIMGVLSSLTGVSPENVAVTGNKFGHIGCSDIAIGFQDLYEKNLLQGSGLLTACCSSGWCAAYLAVPSNKVSPDIS